MFFHHPCHLVSFCGVMDLLISCPSHSTAGGRIKGIFQLYYKKGNHIVVSKTEHKAVLDTMKILEKRGAKITYLDVNSDGLIDIDCFKAALQPTTVLAAVMWVNNETGVIQNIKELSEAAFEKNIPFLCDGTQAIGKLPVDMQTNKIGVMPISAHKFYGPKGVGALYIRRKNPRIVLSPLISGGGQEKKLRAGTLNTPGIVGLGHAIELASKNIESKKNRLQEIKKSFKLFFKGYKAIFNESTENTSNHVLNVTIPGVKADGLLKKTRNLSYSLGSACTSETLDPSHVLTAMGISKEDCFCSFRLSFSTEISDEMIEKVKNTFKNSIIA